jgi:hypothetical protein
LGTRFYPEASRIAVGPAAFAPQAAVTASFNGLGVPALTGDVFGNGKPDLVVGSGNDVNIYDANGNLVSTLPGVGHLDILADLTGQGHDDILVDYTDPTNKSISIRAYDALGTLVNAYTLSALAPDAFLFAEDVADLFGDGRLEIVATVGSLSSISPRGIAIFDAQTGALLNYHDQASVASNVSIGDIFGNGTKQLVYGGWGQWTGQDGWDGTRDDSSYIWALDGSANPLWRQGPLFSGPDDFGRQYDPNTQTWSFGAAYVSAANNAFRNSTGYNDSWALLSDYFGDSRLEVATSASTDVSNASAYLNALSSNPDLPSYPDLPNFVGQLALRDAATGSTLPGYSRNFGAPVEVLGSADLAGDGSRQILAASLDLQSGHWFLHAISPTPGLPDATTFDLGPATSAGAQPTLALGDITGGGSPDIIVGYGPTLHVLDHNLNELWNWNAGSGQVLLDSILTDMGNDGKVDILATSYNPNDVVNGSVPTTTTILAPPSGGTPTAIPPDRFEPDETKATAADLGTIQGVKSYGNLTIDNPNDQDWYKFQTSALGAGDSAVVIAFDPTAGPLDLQVYDASGDLVGSSSAAASIKLISLAGLPAGTYYAHVSGHNGATSPNYLLTIDGPAGATIPADAYEPNDTLATATDLNPPDPAHTGQDLPLTGAKTISHLTITSSTDVDYFQFTTAATGTDGDAVRIDFDNTQGNLDLALLDSSGNVLESVPPSDTNEKSLSLSGLAAGSYYVLVSGHNRATSPDYSLTVTAPQPTGPSLPPDWTGGTHTSLATAFDLGTIAGQHSPITGLRINNSGVDEWFKFTTGADGTDANLVRIDFLSALGQLGLELDDGSGDVLASSSAPADFEQVSLGGLAAGTYYLRIFGASGATNPLYTLTIDAPAVTPTSIPPDWAEPNNTQDTAYDLGQVQGQQQWTKLSIYQSGKDEWFQFEQALAGDLSVRIDFSYAQGGLDLEVIDPSGQSTTSTTTNDSQEVDLAGASAGTYYVHVSGYDGATNPNYTLTVKAPATPTIAKDWIEPPNNTQDAAYDLGSIQGHQQLDKLSIYQAGADEWFKFTTVAAGGQSNLVRIAFDPGQGGLDLELDDSSGNVLAQSTTVGTGKEISLSGMNAGTYWVHVFGPNGATNPNYSLVIEAPTASSSGAQWDVLVYGDGDQQGGQNRDYDVARDIQALEQTQLPSQVNVGVIWGRSPESTWGTNTVEGWLSYDPNSQYGSPSSPLTQVTDANGNDPDMGSGDTLRDFLIKMMKDRPAAHVAVIIKDHGGAWTGAEEDDSTNHIISAPGIRNALSAAEQATGHSIDLVAFDTCLMATAETLYDMRSVASVVVASEAETYSGRQNPDGSWQAATWNLATMVGNLGANPSMSAETFAATMVQDMTPGKITEAMGATRTSAYDELASAMNAFGQAVANSTDPSGDWAAIIQARSQTVSFTDETQDANDRDLGVFMSLVAQSPATQAVRDAAQAVADKISAAVIATNPTDGSISGISTFLPTPGSLAPFDGRYSVVDAGNFDLFTDGSGHATPWYQFVESLANQPSSNASNAIVLGPAYSAPAKADPLHALAGTWTAGTFALAPGTQGTWFALQTLATGGSGDGATIQFANAQGNLTLVLTDSSGKPLETSHTTNGTETVSLADHPAGTYDLHVTGAQGNPAYTLSIQAPAVSTPQRDWTGANNSLPKAFDLGAINPAGSRFIGLTMDAGSTNSMRQKWFAVNFPITPTPTLNAIDLEYAQGSPHNLHLALYDANGKLVQSGTATSGGQSIQRTGLTDRYYLLVSGADTTTTNPGYALQFNTSAPPVSHPGAFQFSAASYSVAENGGSITITVDRTGGSDGTATVHYTTADGSGHTGVNYEGTSGTLTFGPGVTSQSFVVPVLDDGQVNGATTATIVLASPTGGAALSDPSSATLTIDETDHITTPISHPIGDFDGDGRTDPAVFEPSTATFYIAESKMGNEAIQFGIGTNNGGNPVNVSASYEGDGITDPAVFEPSTSTFYIHTSRGNEAIQFGIGTLYGGHPIPVPADYEGDGIIDPAVFEPSTSTFYIARHNAPNATVQFGIGTNYGGHPVPVPGNFEGDGRVDPAVFEPSTSTFFIARHNAPNEAVQFGIGTLYGGSPVVVPGNYEGDGTTDPAVFEPSTATFFIARHNAPNEAVQFGIGTRYGGHPVVVPADYEGDGQTDPAVFEPSTATFFIARHNAPNEAVQFGQGSLYGGHPIVSPGDFEGDGRIDPAVFEPSTSTFFIARHNAPNASVQFGQGTLFGGHPVPISSPMSPASTGGVVTGALGTVVANAPPPAPTAIRLIPAGLPLVRRGHFRGQRLRIHDDAITLLVEERARPLP